METQGVVKPRGGLALRIIPPGESTDPFNWRQTSVPAKELTLGEIYHHGFAHRGNLPFVVRQWRRANFRHLFPGLRRVLVARALHLPHFYGQLALMVIAPDGTYTDFGLASTRVVTTAAVNALVDAFQGLLSLNLFRFHALGTGGTGPAVSDTALANELSSQYSPTASTRATGTLTESASNTFVTVGVNTLGTTTSIVEHSVFNQALAGGGVCFDRSVFSSQTVIAGFSLSSTYSFVLNAGG